MTYTIPQDVEIRSDVIKQLESLYATPREVQEQINNIVEWAYDMAYGGYGRDASTPDVE
jgi:hypothetical protein